MTSAQLLGFTSVLALAAGATPVLAQAAPAAATGLPTGDHHERVPSEIVVTAAIPRDRQDVLSGVAVLQGEALTRELRPTIGETLARTPGVSATSFGPNASRPVLRGLQGERVRVLTDGIGSIDVSNTSVDHAVVINPLLAERIEVLRGPEALLYGSSAIGGVVNVLDKRIPRSIPSEPIHLDAIGSYGTAGRERSIGAAGDAALGRQFVIHVDGSYVKTGDLRIGGSVLSPAARARARANAGREDGDQLADGIDFAASAALRDRLPNTASETWTVGAGAALVTDNGSLGLAYSHYDSLYGVPIRFATAPGQEQEAPRIDLKQDRIDARAEIRIRGGFLDTIRGRFGYADYRHFELEENGDVGTAFYSKGLEGRLELVQANRGGWTGASGVQYFARDFDVVGDEAFLPRNATEQTGLFTLQQLELGRLKLEAGGRYEHSRQSANPGANQPQFFAGTRSFDAVSFSGGASYGLFEGWRAGISVSRSQRAPSAEELFANGPHAGTEAFEIGSPDLAKERSVGVDAVLRGRGRGYTLELSAYHNWFGNFIYETQTGAIEDGLPVFQNGQARARYYGFEVQGSATLARFGGYSLVADALADYVRATIRGVGPAPRIPPLRLLGGLGVSGSRFGVHGEIEWVDGQDRTAAFETRTPSYKVVNAEVTFKPWGKEAPLTFLVQANNLFDVDARRHASFLKDFAPLAGRDIRVTARATF